MSKPSSVKTTQNSKAVVKTKNFVARERNPGGRVRPPPAADCGITSHHDGFCANDPSEIQLRCFRNSLLEARGTRVLYASVDVSDAVYLQQLAGSSEAGTTKIRSGGLLL